MRLLLFLAVLPSILLAHRVLSYDRIEREPAGLLIKLFVLGALSCIPAGLLEGAGMGLIYSVTSSEIWISRLTYLLLVPLAEEGCKYLALHTSRKSPEFNYTFDGIVYGAIVGLGFATLENVLYVLDAMAIEVAVLRGVLAVPLHCTCGIFMGYYYGVARGQEVHGHTAEMRRARLRMLLVPCLIHGIYDYSMDTDSVAMLVMGIVFTLIVFAVASRQVRIASANDAPIMVSLSTLATPLTALQSPKGHRSKRGTPPPPFSQFRPR